MGGRRVLLSPQDRFNRVLASLDDATLDDSKWPVAAGHIDDACDVDGSAIVLGEGSLSDEVTIFFARLCKRGERRTDLEREYFDIFYPIDERIPRLRVLPEGKVIHNVDLYTKNEKNNSRAYNEFMLPNGIQNSINVRMESSQGSRIVWNVLNRLNSGGWNSAQIKMIYSLLPHVRRFVELRQELFDANALRATLSQLLGNTRCGVIQLDWRGRIVERNDYAGNVLRAGDGLYDRHGFLRARRPGDNENLQQLLNSALPRLGDRGVSGSVTLGRLSVAPRLLLYAIPVGEQQRNFEIPRVSALVVVLDPATKAPVDPAVVTAALDLTPTEGLVATLLATGSSIPDIALSAGREESTVRWHVKRIFRKQGISRQAELIRRVLELSGLRL